ncbi:acyl-CoA synthetase [Ramlibacter rhizophilus]|uniref:AMP-binding protein n=1 Tax=Ramlibacter rhizophilus TaxID=1781167 RepID=A0A4Z0BPP2_9BURK|nr:AMP-binding protein [Ramlibacter rhizophilus]TFY99948.1 AMP-binding protein [Ramlibacter rhizophilus]
MAGSQARDTHAALHGAFRWQVPEHFNIAQACCGRWAEADDAAGRVAILAHGAPNGQGALSYAELQRRASRLSHLLADLGVQRGDRVALVLPQRFETAIAYMAILQMGAVAMPLSMLFGPEALQYRLQDSGAVVALCDETAIASLAAVRKDCPALRCLVGLGAAALRADIDWAAETATRPTRFTLVDTLAEDPAVLIYTSGTTGPPKGALIPHRALIGNLPGFVCSQNWFGFDPEHAARASQAVFWSPADWAWTGGLMDALLPTLYFGRPIVAWNGRFSPELAFELMQQHGVTHSFLFPTALKAMMKAVPEPRRRYKLRLEAIMSAGEAVGDAVFHWCREALGVVVNEMFGQTEINYIVGNCAMNGRDSPVAWPARPGSMGRPYPGHRVAVIDEDGHECPPGVAGDVALHRLDAHGAPDPIFFLGYWNNPKASADKFSGDWCRTGDLAVRDEDGYLWYQGRADDVFKAAGYRIGPGEIENCLVKHPAVANAAVVPKPDRERGAVVKAYVVLSAQAQEERSRAQKAAYEARLVAQLQEHVKGQLAPYEYPKEIEFIEQLPMTTTGKVQRRVLRLQEEARAREAA